MAHEHDGVVGHPAGGIEHVGHRHAQLLGGGQVEVVKADGAGPQVLDPHIVEAADVLRPQGVGGGADGVVAPGQLHVLRGGVFGAVVVLHPQLGAPLVKQGLLIKFPDGVGKQFHTVSRAGSRSPPLSPLWLQARQRARRKNFLRLYYSPFPARPQGRRSACFFSLGCTFSGNWAGPPAVW